MTSPLQTDVSWDGVVATVTVVGELDITTARGLCHRLAEVALAHPDRVVLNLGGLVFADAAAASAFDDTHMLLEAGCPVTVSVLPTRSGEVSGLTAMAETESDPDARGPVGDLVLRLNVARSEAKASYERTADLLQRTEDMLAQNRLLRQEVQETCLGARPGQAQPELLQRSAYARLVAQLQTMPVIEQAKGIIMAQSACSDAEAFDMLRRASQRSNVPVRELAAQLVAKSAGTAPSDAAETAKPGRGRREHASRPASHVRSR